MKPVLPPTSGQPSAPNTSPPKPLPAQNITHNVPTSYTQPVSHVPQNLGIPHSTTMTQNMVPTMASQNTNQNQNQNQQPMNQAQPISTPPQISTSPNKNVGLPSIRPNMIPFHPNSNTEEGTTLPPSQNAAQLMVVHREQQMAQFNKPQSNGTAPAQPEATATACNKSPTVPAATAEVRPEPPQATTQNHIPESAKQPATETPPEPPQPTVSHKTFKFTCMKCDKKIRSIILSSVVAAINIHSPGIFLSHLVTW